MAEDKRKTPQNNMRRGGWNNQFREKEKPKDLKKSLKRLFSYLSSFETLLIGLIIVVVLYSLITIGSNVIVKNVVSSLGTYDSDAGVFNVLPDEKRFFTFLIILLSGYLLVCILRYFMTLMSSYLSVKTVRKMRNELFRKIVYLPISYLDKNSHGDIMSRMTNDVDNVSNAISSSLSSLISGVLTIIGCLAIMIWYSPLLTVVSLITLVLTVIFTFFLGKVVRPLFKKQQIILGQLNAITEETVTGYKTVIAYNHQDNALSEFSEQSTKYTKVGIKSQILAGSMGPVMNFIGNIGYFLVCILGSIFVLKGIGKSLLGVPIDVAVVIMFLTTTKQFTRPINEIAQLYSTLVSAMAGAERVFKILDEDSEDFSGEIDLDVESVKGEIDFNHINFSYVEGKPVLKDFNIDIRAGHKIALVGATGSGKTTIVNLLLRFYDLDSGSIEIDKKDISKISKKQLRDTISIVLQDPILFGDSIENNIKYGNDKATDKDVDKALAFANCDSFVNALEDGKKTVLSEGATNISQGQRQLLTIARAVIADSKILILDEATSSVDTRTEKNIQDAMVKLMKNRTSIIIAHRLSTIQDADLIIVLDNGCVKEVGNHYELLEIEDGVYKKLYDTQFKGLNT
ncbi:MAG: ABC transporter ATP-binding protein/permease [Gammaproteobacteria bacterium]|nr:ABC transporter ATP-binding protein/permease [Gammaproteobacteria bacterium]